MQAFISWMATIVLVVDLVAAGSSEGEAAEDSFAACGERTASIDLLKWTMLMRASASACTCTGPTATRRSRCSEPPPPDREATSSISTRCTTSGFERMDPSMASKSRLNSSSDVPS